MHTGKREGGVKNPDFKIWHVRTLRSFCLFLAPHLRSGSGRARRACPETPDIWPTPLYCPGVHPTPYTLHTLQTLHPAPGFNCLIYLTSYWPAGSHLLIRGLLLRNALLPDGHLVDSGQAAPAPLAFNLSSSNASLVLDGCTIVTTSCDNLAQFAVWISEQQQQQQQQQQPPGNTTQVCGSSCMHVAASVVYAACMWVRLHAYGSICGDCCM